MNWFQNISMCIDSRQSIQLCPYHMILDSTKAQKHLVIPDARRQIMHSDSYLVIHDSTKAHNAQVDIVCWLPEVHSSGMR